MENEIDLFSDYNSLPSEVKSILDSFNITFENGASYDDCNNFILELNKVGFTCDYGLDAVPYGLQKIKA